MVERWVAVRGGTYVEPSRFEPTARIHGTAGVDLRVPLVWDWRLSITIDGATQYLNGGLGLGFWH